MDDLTRQFAIRADGVRIAFEQVRGKGPTLVFLPGYMSDMAGTKALALEAWALKRGRSMLRLDYSGCGASGGRFEDGTLDIWRDDVLTAIGLLERGPVVLVGSSMGGWLMLLVARALGDQVTGLVGIAAAPDFTDWGYTSEEKGLIERHGHIVQPSDYGDPMPTYRAFWQSGKANRQLTTEIPITCPVRLLHGQRDNDVPWDISVQLAAALRSDDVQVTLVKDGDHRLSRDQDIALLIEAIEALLARLP
jgi:pimeloyl-ACP methyl ester carboxylesterase